MTATAILLSWNRLPQLVEILAHLQRIPIIDEVIVWNSNPKVYPFRVDGVTVVNCTSDLGLWARFAAASLAKNDAILFQDDDLLVDEPTIKHLVAQFEAANDGKMQGLFGRTPLTDGTYVGADSCGQVPIVLTRCVVADRRNCIRAMQYTRAIDAIGGKPQGNGEDILLSYVSGGGIAYDMHGGVQELGSGDENSIHRRFDAHSAHRTKVVQWCLANIKT